MDIVYIRELRADTLIGVYEWERSIRQTVVLDIEMATDNRLAAATDAIDDALDYAAVSARILGFLEQSQFQLIETMAEQVADRYGAEVGVALTGVAGPGPSDGVDPGTVVVAVTTPDGSSVRTVRLPGDRERVRRYAAAAGLHLLRRALEG